MKFKHTLFVVFCGILVVFYKAQPLQFIDKLKECRDSSEKIKLFISLGNVYNNEGKHIDAISAHKKAVELALKIKDTLNIIASLTALGNSYSTQGIYAAALACDFEILTLSEKRKDKKLTATVFSNIGICFWRQGDNKKALVYLNKALAINIDLNEKKNIAGNYNNLGIVYRGLGNYAKALDLYINSIAICKEINDKNTLMQTLNNQGYIYQLNGNAVKALDSYSASLQLANELNNRLQKSIVMGNMGALFNELKKYDKAEEYLLKALVISITMDDPEGIKEVSLNLSDLYQKTGKAEKALFYYKEFVKQQEALKNEEIKRDFLREEIKHDYEKEKIALQSEQEKQKAITISESKRQQQIIYSVSACLCIVALLLVFLFQKFKVTTAQKNIIEIQKKIVEEKQKEIIDSIQYAKRIQDSLLAHHDLIDKTFPQNFVFFKPKDIVSGDFYWATNKNDSFYIAVCDSTGHGVPGAFMSLLNIGYLSEAINEKGIYEPNLVLNYVRERLITSVNKDGQKDGFDGILLKLTTSNSITTATYSAAYNSPVIISGNQLMALPCDKMPVGIGERSESFRLQTIDVKKGDTVYLYTDGYADQFGGPTGKKFKYKQLEELLLKIHSLPVKEQQTILGQKLNEWRGALEQVDDILVVGIKV